jgi:hypothetical protein
MKSSSNHSPIAPKRYRPNNAQSHRQAPHTNEHHLPKSAQTDFALAPGQIPLAVDLLQLHF